MSFMKQYLHALQEKQQADSQLMYELMEKDAFEDEMFFNADKHHELQQAMMEEMEEPQEPEDYGVDPDNLTNIQETNDQVPF